MSDVIEISDPARLPSAPLVSVVMLAYGHETCLAQAIESVLAQVTAFDFELLIGEDCSPDRSRAIALEFQARRPDRIRVLFGPVNIGGNRNSLRTVRAARGKYVAFCEGDDYWTRTDKLQRQAVVLEHDDTATLVHTDYDRLVGTRLYRSVRARTGGRSAEGALAAANLLRSNIVVTATSMYRRSVLQDLADSGLADPAWPFGDYPKALHAALRGTVHYLPESTAVYRYFPGSATARGRKARLRMYLAAHECRIRFLALASLPAEVKHDIVLESHRRLLRMCLRVGDREQYRSQRAALETMGVVLNRGERAFAAAMLRSPLLAMAVRVFESTRKRWTLAWRGRHLDPR